MKNRTLKPLVPDALAYSIPATATTLSVSRAYVYGLLTTGELKGVKAGGRTLVLRSEIERYLASLPAFKEASESKAAPTPPLAQPPKRRGRPRKVIVAASPSVSA